MSASPISALGLDFGTTNSVAAFARNQQSTLIELQTPHGPDASFRSALCFWEDDTPGQLAVAAGPWAIAEYLDFPESCRFLQSFKSVAANRSFEHASVFEKRLRFEQMGQYFLREMQAKAKGQMGTPNARVERLVVGRPVVYAGYNPDEALARTRYDLMFQGFADEIHYVYEPLGAAFSYASRITEPATILVADFGGGTSDFSVVRIEAPGAAQRCKPLGHAGVGIAGDRLDARLVEKLVMPLLGKGGSYKSFDKILEIPPAYFADFSDWSRLALMRNKRTLADLERLRKAALDPEAIARMIAIIAEEQGFNLHDAVSRVKRALSSEHTAHFHFKGAGLTIEADVRRADFEDWIAPEIRQLEMAVDRALASAGIDAQSIDRVFLTGGTSLVPRVAQIFRDRFGEARLATGGELTSIAHGLALIGEQPDLASWAS